MTKRSARSSALNTSRTMASSASLSSLERQVITIAEQLGRIAASAQAKAEGWVNPPAFQLQMARIRNRASSLLSRLNQHMSNDGEPERKTIARERSREKVAAPGKKHRKPPQPNRGVKHSDERVTKALASRRRKAKRPRQG